VSRDPGEAPPPWMLPEGVDGPLWHYTHSEHLAETEDEYFRGHPLFEADARLLGERFIEPGPLVDLGCGAGRLSLLFARRGFRVVGVDLSASMLATALGKARAEGLDMSVARANLCRLGMFADGTFAYALAMFSTIGMIRGAAARRRAVAEAFRILRPGGRLALHAHNVWLNLGDRQGRRWLAGQVWGAIRGRPGFGDRLMTYRGVHRMAVHLYRWGELRSDLYAAGFVLDEVISLNSVTARVIAAPALLPGVRAGGWIVLARKPGGVREK
jgi:SAM-dependent methyltransferase